MGKHKYTLLYNIGTTLLFLILLTACKRNTVYYHYEHPPLIGWEKNDTIIFQLSPVKEAGTYEEEIGIRITDDYPFTSIYLVVDQTILPAHKKHSDTLEISLMNQQGYSTGQGVSNIQYIQPLRHIDLAQGDSLHITVRHDMKREIMPGVTDIGVKISKK